MADIHIYAPLCITAGAILPPVCIGLVALRFYIRKTQRVPLGWDDWLTLPALILFIGMCVSMLIGVGEHAVGYDAPPISPGKNGDTMQSHAQSQTRKVYWSIELMQIPVLTFLKLSFVFFYRRFFLKGSALWYKWLLNAMIALIVAWGIAYFFTFIFICPGDPSAYWSTLEDEKKHCVNTVAVHNSYGTTDFLLDFIVFVLPVPPIMKLKMTMKKRLLVMGVFFLGAFTVVFSAIRMVTYWTSTAVEFKPNTDDDILITGGIYWSVLECGIALICCCLPTCSSLLRRKKWMKNHSMTTSMATFHNVSHRVSTSPEYWWSHLRNSLAARPPSPPPQTKSDNMSQDSEE